LSVNAVNYFHPRLARGRDGKGFSTLRADVFQRKSSEGVSAVVADQVVVPADTGKEIAQAKPVRDGHDQHCEDG
jgi:hypothetical protein